MEVDTPYLDTRVSPALRGDRQALDLRSLHRTQLDYTLTVDLSALSRVTPTSVVPLFSHLASDPRWRVSEIEGLITAVRRTEHSGRWTLGGSAYNAAAEGPWRVLLRSGRWSDDHPWEASELVSRVTPADQRVLLAGFVPPTMVPDGRVSTALSLVSSALTLDVYELGPSEDRPRTSWALEELPSLIHNTSLRSEKITRMGFDGLLLGGNEPVRGEATLRLVGVGPGELEFVARLNPGQPGWIWLALRTGDGAYEEFAVTAGSRERIGWSADPAHKFYAQSRLMLPRGPAFSAKAEVWFLPDRGDARMLLSRPVEVPAR
jgi:hypothetical protein